MRKYEVYKDSGVEWIGSIPSHWEMRKIGRSFSVIGSGTTPNTNVDEYYADGVVPWINTGDLNDGVVVNASKHVTQKAIKELSALRVFPAGSLLVAMYGATIGKIAIMEIDGCVNQACCVLNTSEFFYQKYIFYWFLVNKPNIINLSYGGGQPNISQEIIRSLKITCPTKDEQEQIVAFLDNKLSQVDTAIESKRQLIDLLNEEKAALINHAVTKGIDNTAPLKPSGIQWLDDIPAHWSTAKLKFIALIRYGLGQPPKLKEGGLPLIRATNVDAGQILEKDMLYVDPDDVPYDRDPVLLENDIIVVRSGAYTADSAIIPKKYEGAITGYDMVVRVQNANPKFIAYSLLSNCVLTNQLYLHRLRAAQPHLNREELGETIFILPDQNEQKKIIAHIDRECKKITTTIEKIEKEIELLTEYKTSLIYEVVTGKLKAETEVGEPVEATV